MPINLPSTAAKLREAAIQLRIMAVLDRQFAATLAPELVRIGQLAAAAYAAHGLAAADAIVSAQQTDLLPILEAHWLETADVFGNRLSAKEGAKDWQPVAYIKRVPTGVVSPFDAWVNTWGAERVEGISNATRRKIRAAIIEGQKQGLSHAEVANLIKDKTNGKISNRDALLIARTETHSAAMAVQDMTAESYGVPMIREWISTEDDRTRITHRAANGQKRKLGKKFKVGSSWLEYPGDPSGPPYEIINCRCCLHYAVQD